MDGGWRVPVDLTRLSISYWIVSMRGHASMSFGKRQVCVMTAWELPQPRWKKRGDPSSQSDSLSQLLCRTALQHLSPSRITVICLMKVARDGHVAPTAARIRQTSTSELWNMALGG